MRVLTVPNWSFGRDKELLARMDEDLRATGLLVHYVQSDVDHNRTVTAFSGPSDEVAAALLGLCELALPRIDLNRHMGVHPRIGALDVCPFVTPWEAQTEEVTQFLDDVASQIAERFALPVFLYEKSEKGRHEADLPTLRKGGFGSLHGRILAPDFGPDHAHARLGATILGWRDFLIAMNVDLETGDLQIARKLAKTVRALRSEGDPRFLGVRALGLPLPSRGQTQLSLNLTLPDLTPVDPIIEWVQEQCVALGVRVVGPELIGVVRDSDVEHATRLPFKKEQVIVTR